MSVQSLKRWNLIFGKKKAFSLDPDFKNRMFKVNPDDMKCWVLSNDHLGVKRWKKRAWPLYATDVNFFQGPFVTKVHASWLWHECAFFRPKIVIFCRLTYPLPFFRIYPLSRLEVRLLLPILVTYPIWMRITLPNSIFVKYHLSFWTDLYLSAKLRAVGVFEFTHQHVILTSQFFIFSRQN